MTVAVQIAPKSRQFKAENVSVYVYMIIFER